MMNDLKISQQAGVINTNLDAIEAEIREQMVAYKDYLVTEDSVKDDKKVLAELRKLKKDLDDARIATKKQWLAPFEEFEARCKAVVGLVDEPINLINSQIKLFDEEKKIAKQVHIKELYDANIQGLENFLPFEKVMESNPKWLNASTKDQDILFDLNGMTLRIKNDLSAIEALNSEIKDELIECYQRSGNDLSKAIQRNSQFIEDRERTRQRLEEEAKRKAEEEAKKKAEEEIRVKAEAEIKAQISEQKDLFETEEPLPFTEPDNEPFELDEPKRICFIVSEKDAEEVRNYLTFSEIKYEEVISNECV